MKPLDRNISILEHIINYCNQIEETIQRFGNSYGTADPEITWEILVEDIPAFKEYCAAIIKEHKAAH
ncbi:MAG: hypothetical protein MJ075_05900 [Oscillospiraceae bacterium]|nr:hypothetical protein [Oscillospiraceae bacterium]